VVREVLERRDRISKRPFVPGDKCDGTKDECLSHRREYFGDEDVREQGYETKAKVVKKQRYAMKGNLIEPRVGKPINDLIWSINHYMSLADHLGMGMGRDLEDRIVVWILVNQEMALDQENFQKLRARMKELKEEGEWRFSLTREGRENEFEVHGLHVPHEEVEELSEALREEAGPEGWGSTRDVLLEKGLLDASSGEIRLR
jgi:hypothetical protein